MGFEANQKVFGYFYNINAIITPVDIACQVTHPCILQLDDMEGIFLVGKIVLIQPITDKILKAGSTRCVATYGWNSTIFDIPKFLIVQSSLKVCPCCLCIGRVSINCIEKFYNDSPGVKEIRVLSWKVECANCSKMETVCWSLTIIPEFTFKRTQIIYQRSFFVNS